MLSVALPAPALASTTCTRKQSRGFKGARSALLWGAGRRNLYPGRARRVAHLRAAVLYAVGQRRSLRIGERKRGLRLTQQRQDGLSSVATYHRHADGAGIATQHAGHEGSSTHHVQVRHTCAAQRAGVVLP